MALETMVSPMVSPSTKVEVLKASPEPTVWRFLVHWYCGLVPPLETLAEKETVLPAQMAGWLAEMVTAGVTCGFTVITKELDCAVTGCAQVALLVTCTVTMSLLARVLVVKTALFGPTFTLFTFH